MSEAIELTVVERREAEAAAAPILGAVALHRRQPDAEVKAMVDAVIKAVNAKRAGAAVGTVVRNPETGAMAQRIEAGPGGSRHWSGLTPMMGPMAVVGALVADEVAEKWDVLYTPPEPDPLERAHCHIQSVWELAAQLDSGPYRYGGFGPVDPDRVPDGEIVEVPGGPMFLVLPADGLDGIYRDDEGDLFRYFSARGVGGGGSWFADRGRGRWQFADRSVRKWGDVQPRNLPRYLTDYGPYRRVTIQPEAAE